jgi:SAM-dependent methyltransferase
VGFEWDPNLYSGSARFYLKGRLPYAPAMARAIARELELDGRGRLLDVGCGPGIVALDLASLFEEVVGIDADSDMVAEAEAEARRLGIMNARWEHIRAEELPAGLGLFRVVTLAQSFHWMNREQVAATIHAMLERAGALVHISAYTRTGVDTAVSLPHPQPPWQEISELVRRYLGSETRAGQGLRDAVLTGEDEIFSQWFVGPHVVKAPDGRVLTRTDDHVVAAVYSVSSSAPHLFGDHLRGFESDLRRLLVETSPTREFSQQTGDTALHVWRPR